MAKIESDKSKAYDSNPLYGTPFYTTPSDLLVNRPLAPSAHDILHGIGDGIGDGIGRFFDDLGGGVGALLDGNDLTRPTARPSSGSGGSSGGHSAESVHSSSVTPVELDYLNAAIAKHYGMSKETAYQEALSNTAYQRSVKDMQAAGLNPAVIYGSGKGSTADGVYGASSLDSGGGSGGSSRRYSGSSSNNGKLFTKGQFYGISAAAGLVSAVVSGNPNSYWIGQTVAQGFMTAANSLFGK